MKPTTAWRTTSRAPEPWRKPPRKQRGKRKSRKSRSDAMPHERLSIVVAILGLLLAAAPAPAHHAFGAEFNADKPIALRGTVTMMEWVNPHSWIHIDVKGPDGAVVNWMVEGGSPNSLLRLGFTKNAVLPGMEIVVEGFQ